MLIVDVGNTPGFHLQSTKSVPHVSQSAHPRNEYVRPYAQIKNPNVCIGAQWESENNSRGDIMLKNNLFHLTAAVLIFLGMTGSALAQSNHKDLEKRIYTALNSYPTDKITVSADDRGVVTIGGDVDVLYDKLDIYQIVSKINGVTEIKDKMVVNTPIVADDVIKANVLRTIQDNSVILEPDKITVSVDKGMVFLRGTVSYYREKLMAATIASWQDGVQGIANEINVLPSQEVKSDENITSILNEILKDRFPLSDGVRIKVTNGDVTVDGYVGNLWEKTHIKDEFMQVRGVKSVTENLQVKPRV